MKNANTGRLGFTLIELLVVVLIIGILASIALPQYRIAVAKSRFANIKQIIAGLKTAEETYYLANSAYTPNLQTLDLEYTCEVLEDDASIIRCDNYFVIDVLQSSTYNTLRAAYCPGEETWNNNCKTNYDFMYTVWLDQSENPGKITCTAKTKLGSAVCAAN